MDVAAVELLERFYALIWPMLRISALLIAPACVLRLTAETCAIVIVAKQAVVFNMINESPPKPQKSSGTKIP